MSPRELRRGPSEAGRGGGGAAAEGARTFAGQLATGCRRMVILPALRRLLRLVLLLFCTSVSHGILLAELDLVRCMAQQLVELARSFRSEQWQDHPRREVLGLLPYSQGPFGTRKGSD